MTAAEKNEIDKDFLGAELFEAISHPTRIQILRTLIRDALGFAELKHKLGISSSGNLSHHLNKLVALVETNTQGKYKLTERGHEALHAIETIQIKNESWIATTYALIGALLFYGIYLTVAIISGIADILGIADVLIPASGAISTVIFYVIYRTILIRALRRGTLHLGWRRFEGDYT